MKKIVCAEGAHELIREKDGIFAQVLVFFRASFFIRES